MPASFIWGTARARVKQKREHWNIYMEVKNTIIMIICITLYLSTNSTYRLSSHSSYAWTVPVSSLLLFPTKISDNSQNQPTGIPQVTNPPRLSKFTHSDKIVTPVSLSFSFSREQLYCEWFQKPQFYSAQVSWWKKSNRNIQFNS